MNKQLKNFMLVIMTVLLLSACGQVETPTAPTETPELIIPVTEAPTDIPADDPLEGPTPENFINYVGLTYLSLPEGLSQGFSLIIQDSSDRGLSLVINGANKMLWLEKISHYDENGVPIWEVKDILSLSNLESGLTLLPDGCFMNGVPDSEIFVAGKNGAIILAWRANTTLDKFEAIPVNGITCDSDKAVNIT